MGLLSGCKLTYFGLAGRGDPIRLALAHAGVDFTDNRIGFPDWGPIKPTTPFGQLPILELDDGTVISQMKAILRLIGKDTGLYPEDPVAAARVDELMDAFDDIAMLVNAAGRGLEQDAKEQARKEAVSSGNVFEVMTKIEAFISKHGEDGFCIGDSPTVADFQVAVGLSFIGSGFYDGVDGSAFKPFPTMCAVRTTVGNLPSVVEFYSGLAPEIKDKYPATIMKMGEDF
jgi:glutathione S-transferase